ncbi:MAG: magnesium/cobalt efflux protein [Magnetovibrio sp.]|nr:magnesium/cobalt efflux protein [Magnetovibrio sp.]|tara:strand:+ start:3299 stop:4201 length:903 start_codon:yes stop_codon:yes gene_type:complete
MNDQVTSTLPDKTQPENKPIYASILAWLKTLRRERKDDSTVRDALEEIIEERGEPLEPINNDERALLANILDLRDRTIHDVMVPRADIVAVGSNVTLKEAINLVTGEGHSRLPVYNETLDNAIGFIHAKDMLAWRNSEDMFSPEKILRKILFVAPSMHVLELLLEMRVKRAHMALVVDEYGGIDGLVTIEDLVEEIVGEIEDEHDQNDEPSLQLSGNEIYVADARVEISSLEEAIGVFVSEDERENIDTLGGLVFGLAGHVPIRGELVLHPSGVEFEILDADPRRIQRLRVRTTNFNSNT